MLKVVKRVIMAMIINLLELINMKKIDATLIRANEKLNIKMIKLWEV